MLLLVYVIFTRVYILKYKFNNMKNVTIILYFENSTASVFTIVGRVHCEPWKRDILFSTTTLAFLA